MPVNKVKIPIRDPASAGFSASDIYYGPDEPLFDASAEIVDVNFKCVLTADTDLPYLAVVKAVRGGALTQAAFANKDNNGVLAAPVKGLSGATVDVVIHTSGHFNSNALVFPGTYDTDVKKQQAFDAGNNNIRVSTPKYNGSQINIDN